MAKKNYHEEQNSTTKKNNRIKFQIVPDNMEINHLLELLKMNGDFFFFLNWCYEIKEIKQTSV